MNICSYSMSDYFEYSYENLILYCVILVFCTLLINDVVEIKKIILLLLLENEVQIDNFYAVKSDTQIFFY